MQFLFPQPLEGGIVQKIFRSALASAVLFLLLAVPSFASTETDVSYIRTDVSSIKTYISNISSSLGSSLGSNVSSIKTDTSSIVGWLRIISSDIDNYLSAINTKLASTNSYLSSIESDSSNIKTSVSSIQTNVSDIKTNTSSSRSYLQQLVNFFVNPDHKALEDASLGAVQSAADIVNGSDDGASTASNVSDVGALGSDVSGLLSNPASPDNALDILTSGQTGVSVGLFDWFTQTTLDNLNGSSSRRSSSGPDIVTHYYEDNVSVFNDLIGGGDMR